MVRKAGRRQAHREVHRHLGRPVNLVSLDAMPFEVADDLHRPPVARGFVGPRCGRPPACWRSVTTTTW